MEMFLSLPGSRPFRTGLRSIAKTRINAGIQLNQSPEEPNEIREAIEISQHFRLYLLPALSQAHRVALGTPANGASDFIRSRFRVRTGQRPIRKNSFGGFDLINQLRQKLDVFRSDVNLWFFAFGRCCQRRTKPEERLLDLLRPTGDLCILTNSSRKAQHGIQFVYRTISFDPQVRFRNSDATCQTGLSCISMLGCNTHLLSPSCRTTQQYCWVSCQARESE